MENLPNFGPADRATVFATLGGGLFPLRYCRFMLKQPSRWIFVYWMILVTGVFVIALHGFGETNPFWGERRLWSFRDMGSDIVVMLSVTLIVLGDYSGRKSQNWAMPVAAVGIYFARFMPSGTRWVLSVL